MTRNVEGRILFGPHFAVLLRAPRPRDHLHSCWRATPDSNRINIRTVNLAGTIGPPPAATRYESPRSSPRLLLSSCSFLSADSSPPSRYAIGTFYSVVQVAYVSFRVFPSEPTSTVQLEVSGKKVCPPFQCIPVMLLRIPVQVSRWTEMRPSFHRPATDRNTLEYGMTMTDMIRCMALATEAQRGALLFLFHFTFFTEPVSHRCTLLHRSGRLFLNRSH